MYIYTHGKVVQIILMQVYFMQKSCKISNEFKALRAKKHANVFV